MNWYDYTQLRAILAVVGLGLITYMVIEKTIGDMAFAECFVAIFACFTAHSLLDDKFPDRCGPNVDPKLSNNGG